MGWAKGWTKAWGKVEQRVDEVVVKRAARCGGQGVESPSPASGVLGSQEGLGELVELGHFAVAPLSIAPSRASTVTAR